MVVSIFSILNKDGRNRFCEESFLLANVKPDVVLKMPFLTISNADVDFQAQDLQWKSYTTRDALLTIRQVELIRKKEFAIVALDLEHKAFIVYVTAFSIDSDDEVHPSKKAQIAHLKVHEAPTKIPNKYANFANVFSLKLAAKFSKHTRNNDHTIELIDDWQPLYGFIYSMEPVELKKVKAYIKNNLANGFIRPSKSPARVFIFFDKKPDRSLRLCVDYRGLNNLIIKNQYPLPLIGESLDQLG